MSGVIIGGPMGAILGGLLGTGYAYVRTRRHNNNNAKTPEGEKIHNNSVVSILQNTPRHERPEVCRQVMKAIREEFADGFRRHPELKMMFSQQTKNGGRMGNTIHIIQYCLDKKMMDTSQLQKIDTILQDHVSSKARRNNK